MVHKKKKKKKKKSTDRPNFQILVGWGQHNNFFFWPNDEKEDIHMHTHNAHMLT